jgi:phage/plasmid-like protein (TIGR03299 family)
MNIVFANEQAEAPVLEQAELPVANTGGRYEATQGVTPRGSTGYSRKVPWGTAKHVVSHQKLEKYSSVREALRGEDMDWHVEKRDLFTEFSEEGPLLDVDDFKAVVRTDNGYTLGVVKGRYVPFQNRRLAEFTDTLVDVDGNAAALGESFGGRKVWSVIELPEIDSPDGGLGTFLVVSNSHDGTSSLSATFVTVRWACTNGLIALSKAAHTVKIRHTSTMELRLKEAHRVLAQSTSYVEDTTRIMEQLLATPIGDYNKLITRLIPTPVVTDDNKRAVDNAHKRQAEIATVLRRSSNLADVRDTGWGFVNAVAEWNEWEGSHVKRRKLAPMERLLNDSSQGIVHRARDLVLA